MATLHGIMEIDLLCKKFKEVESGSDVFRTVRQCNEHTLETILLSYLIGYKQSIRQDYNLSSYTILIVCAYNLNVDSEQQISEKNFATILFYSQNFLPEVCWEKVV